MAKSFLGRGWKFPIKVDPISGRIMMSEYEEDIAEAIRIILSTLKGERVMRPTFGCGIHSYAFGLTNSTTLKLMESSVKEAIQSWEPRVYQVEVEANPDPADPGKVLIRIAYAIRSTNNLFNIVYPFYISEGTK